MAAATWLDDDSANVSEEQQAATDELEQQVYGLLQQVASYMRQLEQSPGSAAVAAPAAGLQGSSSSSKAQRPLLPDSVLLFAPPPPSRQRSVADYLIKAGVFQRGAVEQTLCTLFTYTKGLRVQAGDCALADVCQMIAWSHAGIRLLTQQACSCCTE
jgi:hypothetical protein